jgi:4-amino-4-deoxy-L-arabinose transferase-like glycosyltransferase
VKAAASAPEKVSAFFEQDHAPVTVAAFLCLHTAIWTVYASFSNLGPVHRDMIEAYAWGREFQLGYYKHPPFWSWIAGAWFEIFPRTNWAFYLLATLNSTIAIAGVWQLTGLFTKGAHRLNATLLLLLFPFYTIQGHQFNANFIQLSLWPWTVYFFVLSMNKRRLSAACLFGALAAAGLLSKYYSALLLISCFAASFAHPDWRRYYRSPAPYLSVTICCLLFAPHVWWLVKNDFAPFKYVEEKTAYTGAQIYLSALIFVLGCIGFTSLSAVLTGLSRRGGRQDDEAAAMPVSPKLERFVAILALGPFALTLISALAGHVKLSTNFASPIFFLVPLLLIQTFKPSPLRLNRLAGLAAVLLYGGALLVAPAVPYLFKQQGLDTKHMLGVAREAKRFWRERTGLPLRIVAGAEAYAMATAFYSEEDTSVFLGFDLSHSPWISARSLAETGFLGICIEGDETCRRQAAAYGGPATQEAHIRISGGPLQPVDLRFLIGLSSRPDRPDKNSANAAQSSQ